MIPRHDEVNFEAIFDDHPNYSKCSQNIKVQQLMNLDRLDL